MKTILVDDEPLALEQFKIECESLPWIDLAGRFTSPHRALEYATKNPVDFALLDVDMPEMSGLELGQKLRALYPEMVLMFITAYEETAAPAMRLKADAFITKPYDSADIEDAMTRARLLRARQKKRVFFQTFGAFDMMVDGRPVTFPNRKAKELLALCVDRAGGTVTMEETIKKLWGTDNASSSIKQKYRTAVMNIGIVLEQYHAQQILVRMRGALAINKEEVSADIYRFLEDRSGERLSSYQGNYLPGYPWAVQTNQRLIEMKQQRSN